MMTVHGIISVELGGKGKQRKPILVRKVASEKLDKQVCVQAVITRGAL